MRKYLLTSFTLACSFLILRGQGITLPPSGENQKSSVTQQIGSLVSVTVDYSSPDVHAPNGEDRTGKIWGNLVPYGLTDLGFGLREPAPWRAGANENTTITFSHDVMVEGKPVPAGKYGLHLIVAETGPWTWILSKNNSAWGSYFYTQKEDQLRVDVQPKDNPHTEWLNYTFTDRQPTETTLELQWERKAVPMRISVPNMNDVYIAQISKELQSSPGFDAENYAAAADFLLQQNYNLEKALAWANQAVEGPVGERSFNNVSTKAKVLIKMGKIEEGMNILSAALQLPDATPNNVHQLGRGLLAQNEKEVALRVFKMNYDKNSGAWPTNVGMVRGLSAVGKYEEALPYAEAALAQAPDDANKNSLSRMIERLKSKQDVN